MILTKELWDYIVEKQRILDAAFMKNPRFVPDQEIRELAGLIEVDEFVKEFIDSYKWWSFKKQDGGRIVDEYIDILHFFAGYAIEWGVEAEYSKMKNDYDRYSDTLYKKRTLVDNLINLRAERFIHIGVSRATSMMERLEYTTEELRVAYDRKNAENFRRIAEGY
ncbi:dUTP diphosphatase [Staphylococcus aureus]|uniref:dUTP diphosphatase n=1 Tax=Staphylococcus aureus TaxID=1280 RepID=UPI0020C0CC5E|nr:dUTP diphosphatase [Staphylococcus aureus]